MLLSGRGTDIFCKSLFYIRFLAIGLVANTLSSDKVGNKPWLDSATNAEWAFWSAADEWLPTWGEGDTRGMTVKSVKMWQLGACGQEEEL